MNKPTWNWAALKRARAKDAPTRAPLPRTMMRIARVIGERKTFELIAALGGTLVFVGQRPGDDSLLVKTIGPAAAKRLAREYGGQYLDLPVAGRAVTLWLKSLGLSNNEIARIQRVTAHTVGRRIAASIGHDQMDLFKSAL